MTRIALLLVLSAGCASTTWEMEAGPGMAPEIRAVLAGQEPHEAMLVVGPDFYRHTIIRDGSSLLPFLKAVAAVDATPMTMTRGTGGLVVGPAIPEVYRVQRVRREVAVRYARETIRVIEVRRGDYEVWHANPTHDAYKVYGFLKSDAVARALDAFESATRRIAVSGTPAAEDPFPYDIGGMSPTYSWLRKG